MNNKSCLLFFYLILLSSGFGFFNSCKSSSTSQSAGDTSQRAIAANDTADSLLEKKFQYSALRTNLKKHSIPLDSIFDGGPGKNGIPAIDFPQFVSSDLAMNTVAEVEYGVYVEGKTESKFYPFNIINWHEVVNDELDGHPVAVTFCPLCGTAMVFDRLKNGDTLLFGVSGKLYESNLLMFDDKTESLWSQGLGEAVAGDFTGEKLLLIPSSIISFEDVRKNFPDAKILSVNTGFDRDYTRYPYVDYMSNDNLMFPVSKTDNREFQNKDEMYIVPINNTSVAFAWKPLLKAGHAEMKTPDGTVAVKIENNVPSAIKKETGEALPGYFSFWFSWYVFHQQDGVVWKGK